MRCALHHAPILVFRVSGACGEATKEEALKKKDQAHHRLMDAIFGINSNKYKRKKNAVTLMSQLSVPFQTVFSASPEKENNNISH